MQPRINFITLGVADLVRARAFYEDLLGWRAHAMSNDNVRFYSCGECLMLSIFNKDDLAKDIFGDTDNTPTLHGSPAGFTLAHNLNSEQEVDDLFAKFAQKGVTIIKPPQKVFWGGYSGYIADPDGYFWEIAYNPFLERIE